MATTMTSATHRSTVRAARDATARRHRTHRARVSPSAHVDAVRDAPATRARGVHVVVLGHVGGGGGGDGCATRVRRERLDRARDARPTTRDRRAKRPPRARDDARRDRRRRRAIGRDEKTARRRDEV